MEYNQDIGEFVWLPRLEVDQYVKTWNARYAGKKVGCLSSSRGYHLTSISLGGEKYNYELHRLVWLYTYGEFPSKKLQIDHVNRIKTDNRLENLRIADYCLNGHNVGLTSR